MQLKMELPGTEPARAWNQLNPDVQRPIVQGLATVMIKTVTQAPQTQTSKEEGDKDD